MYERSNAKDMKKTVAYYRVSTNRQGESGLGLEVQQDAVHLFLKKKKLKLTKEFTEIESGKKNIRPVLKEALEYCRKNDALLIIAKLDRLGRNVAFISSLMESRVAFVAVDNPEANHLILHILAAFAQYEREQISIRTKSALQMAKRRGVKLGKNGSVLAAKNKKDSLVFSKKLKPIIEAMKRQGFITIRSLTDELNKQKIATFRPGCRWHKSTVYNLLSKLQAQ